MMDPLRRTRVEDEFVQICGDLLVYARRPMGVRIVCHRQGRALPSVLESEAEDEGELLLL